MTFCFAWKYKNNIGLIADSLITLNKLPENQSKAVTSFGESINKEPVIEQCLKLYNISKTIIGISGDITGGTYNILSEYKDIYKNSDDKLNDFKKAIASEARENDSTSFFIGFINSNGNAKLYKLIVQNCKIEEEEITEYSFIGNPEFNSKDRIINSYISLTTTHNIKPNLLSLSLLAFLQRNGIEYATLKDGVGGIFKSLEILNNEILWSKNIKYLFYVPNKEKNVIEIKNEVGVTFFNNLMVYNSTFSKKHCCIFPPISFCNFNSKEENFKLYIDKKYSDFINNKFYDYYIFYNYLNQNIYIVNYNSSIITKYLNIEKIYDGNYIIKYSSEFLQMLLNNERDDRFSNDENLYYLIGFPNPQ